MLTNHYVGPLTPLFDYLIQLFENLNQLIGY